MQIKIKYFASLRESMGIEQQILSDDSIHSVADIIKQLKRLPENTKVAVNQEYATPETEVEEGDEVAFFPPVTGG